MGDGIYAEQKADKLGVSHRLQRGMAPVDEHRVNLCVVMI